MSDQDENILHAFERNNYFYGKLMTVRDFETEQRYFNEKRHLLNRIIHTSGLVCGFKDLSFQKKDGNLTIGFNDGGVALDGCGREIVVPVITQEHPIIKANGSQPLSDIAYLYIRYKEGSSEWVASASNPSSCDETCCPNRFIEGFEVVLTNSQPSTGIRLDCSELSGIIDSAVVRERIKAWFRKKAEVCLSNNDSNVFLAAINVADTPPSINEDETRKYVNYVTSQELLDLLTCHMSNYNNPHHTTAQQAGALVSVDGVSNPGGNVDLVQANAIVITPDAGNKKIAIGENHSARTDNPHNTLHDQTSPGPVDTNAIIDDIRNKHVSNADANRWNRSLTGVKVGGTTIENPGAAINLQAGSNVTLTPTPETNSIMINASGGTSAPSARTGRVRVNTNSNGISSARVDSGFKDSLFCVLLGIDYGEYVIYGSTVQYEGKTVTLMAQIYQIGTEIGNFDILIDASGLGVRDLTIRWFAIPGIAAVAPSITPITPRTPVEPTTPITPRTPVEPTTPITPRTPVEPTTPITPRTPVEPTTPITPRTPVEPTTPITPRTPVEPTTPITPRTPVEPTTPITPRTPVEPTTPITPRTPVEPTTPIIPRTPVGPITPTIATTPVRPVTRNASIKRISGMNIASENKLIAAGINDVETLSRTAVRKVALALGITNAEARALIDKAKKSVGAE